MKTKHLFFVISMLAMLSACGSSGTVDDTSVVSNHGAAITAVSILGEEGDYTFSISVRSPDTGCEQYADWWEVFKADGTLVHRRILTHSHVDEQPFTRSSGPVAVLADDLITVRAHMNNLGYGEQVFTGSISEGLVSSSIDNALVFDLSAIDLSNMEPLPTGCAF